MVKAFLDKVIDLQDYPVPASFKQRTKTRSIGVSVLITLPG
jgi:ribonucleotide reductase alpha subunit